MKLRRRFSLCTSAVAGEEYSDDPPAGKPSLTASPAATIQSNLSLQTLPSVPSLQSLSSLLDPTTVTLHPSLSSSLSLSSPISSLSLSLSSSLLYAASGHLVHVFSLSPPSPLLLDTFNTDGASHGSVKSVVFTADGKKILTAHQDGKIRVWKKTVNANKQDKHHKLVTSLPTIADKLARFPIPKNHVQVRRHRKRLWIEHHDAVSSLTVSPQNGVVYSASWDKTLKAWGPREGFRCLESVTAHSDAVNTVTVSVDGTVFTGSADGRIRVWGKNEGGKKHGLISTLEKHKSAVNALALSSDGTILFSGACDRSILVWEREDGGAYMRVSGALRGHEGAILCMINVSDYLISGSADRTVRIWRRGFEGRFCCLAVLTGHLKPVKALTGRMMDGEDGILVFSGALDGEIKVWKVKVSKSLSR